MGVASLKAPKESSAFIALFPILERADVVQPLAWLFKCNNSSFNPYSRT